MIFLDPKTDIVIKKEMKQLDIINEIIHTSVPTRILVGVLEEIQDLAELAIKSVFCKQQKDIDSVQECFCIECRRIRNKQHPFFVWISPEKNYSVDNVEIIFERTKFALDKDQLFFFVLDKASSLNQATANKLLKILEEPPSGYKFILLSDNINQLPATITSRSHIIKINDSLQQQTKSPFLKYFISPENKVDASFFEQELKTAQISEQECIELCYDLIEHFLNKLKESDSIYFQNALKIIQNRLRKPPCPGSSNIFLKLLYLDFSQL
jgi:DNA polymerase III subunit delta'